MPRGKSLDPFEEGAAPGDVAKREVLLQRGRIHRRRSIQRSHHALRLRREAEAAIGDRVKERLDPEMVASKNSAVAHSVMQREREHPFEAGNEV